MVLPLRPVSLLAIVALILSVTLHSASSSQAQIGAGATLVVLGGGVTVAAASGTAAAGSTGQSLGAGDQVATSASGRALITFFDGSEVELDINATLQIVEAASSGSQARIGLNAIAGTTVHKVVAFSDPGSSYRISAGSTVLLVRGTLFGHRNDPATGDVTMALAQCGRTLLDPQDCVDYPAPGQRVRVGEKVTSRRDGSIIREPFTPGSSLINDVQAPAGSGGSFAPPAGLAFVSAEACLQQKSIVEGQPFGDALAACALAMTPPTPTPTPVPPPPAEPIPQPIVFAAFEPNTSSVGSSAVTDAPIDVRGPVEEDDDDEDDDSDDDDSDDDDDDDDKKKSKKKDDKKDDKKPTSPPSHNSPSSHGCGC